MAGDIEAGLWAYLQTKITVTDLVGDRVHPQFLPQNPLFPAITYSKISESHQETHQGSAGFSTAIIQIDCWAETDDVARDLAEQVRLVLQGYTGAMGSETSQGIMLLDERKDFEPDDIEQHRVIMDFRFWYPETIPT